VERILTSILFVPVCLYNLEYIISSKILEKEYKIEIDL
jgi:hypothetical protein